MGTMRGSGVLAPLPRRELRSFERMMGTDDVSAATATSFACAAWDLSSGAAVSRDPSAFARPFRGDEIRISDHRAVECENSFPRPLAPVIIARLLCASPTSLRIVWETWGSPVSQYTDTSKRTERDAKAAKIAGSRGRTRGIRSQRWSSGSTAMSTVADEPRLIASVKKLRCS